MCVCLHTRHISISPRFNQCRNPSIESRTCTLILLLTMAMATVLSHTFFRAYFRPSFFGVYL